MPYTKPECALGQLQTSRVLWSDTVQLDPQAFDHPDGYYIVWERCCRNEGVLNIINPRGTGMKYVTEFPPLWKDGAPFVNSSPILFQPLRDYACINQLYYTEFTGFDPDGDSLAYSLASPLNTNALTALPIPRPKPHIPVKFNENAGFSPTAQILGNPNLGIDAGGLLTVNPSATGLFVFSVLVEEFRDGEKIGEVQRDFQMLVIDGCDPPDPPVVGVQIPGNEAFLPEVDTLMYELTDDKCFEYVVTNVTFGETISLRAEGVNFEGDLDEIFEISSMPVGVNQDTLIFTLCAPGCPPLTDGPFIVDLIAGDDACPLQQLDTLRMTIEVEPPPNGFPDVFPPDLSALVDENDTFTRRVIAVDPDNDLMTLSYYLANIPDPSLYGFTIDVVKSEPGLLEADVTWNPQCETFEFGGITQFPLSILVDDMDICEYENPDLLEMDLSLNLPFNSNPVVRIDNVLTEEITVEVNDVLTLDVEVTDADGDLVNLRMAGQDFNPAAIGATFDPASGAGMASSQFNWFAGCDVLALDEDNSFTFLYIGDDEDECRVSNFDTLALTINVEIPENAPPVMEQIADYRLEVNELFTMEVAAADANPDDEITLKFLDGFRLPRTNTLEFEPVTGNESVSSVLSWRPECSLLGGQTSRFYDLIFIAVDDACPEAEFDTTKVTFEIVETRERFEGFLPPNAFSPNDDGMNESFNLTTSERENGNLPPDNCDDSFEYISIHTRSGESVFYSEEREFDWDGGQQPAGVYFYVVKYTKTEYKNYIQLLR